MKNPHENVEKTGCENLALKYFVSYHREGGKDNYGNI